MIGISTQKYEEKNLPSQKNDESMILLYTLLFAIGIVGVCMLLLGIKVLLVKGGRFPNFHIEANPHLRKKGITCATHWDEMERRKKKDSKEVH